MKLSLFKYLKLNEEDAQYYPVGDIYYKQRPIIREIDVKIGEEIVQRFNEYEELKEQNIEYDRRISELENYINSNRIEYSRQETIDKLDKENQELKAQNRELVQLVQDMKLSIMTFSANEKVWLNDILPQDIQKRIFELSTKYKKEEVE